VEGQQISVVVLENLCTDFIVGKDAMRKTDVLLVKLVAAVKECTYEEAKRICATVLSDSSNREKEVDLTHCERAPVILKWKEGAREALPCNTKSALGEARQTELRLMRKNPSLLESYREILKTWEEAGWLKEVDASDVKFCLRHFPVARDPNGATAMKRCRVVVEGSQLTPLLEVDECSHKDMVRNLLRWRTCQRFVCVDISQAYMRVAISLADTYYLCIAWGGRLYRFTSLPMGISPSAQALQETVDNYVEEWERTLATSDALVKVSPYMDDLMALIWAGKNATDVDLDKVEGDARDSLIQFLKSKRMDAAEKKTVTTNGSGMALGVPFSNGKIGVTANKIVAMRKGLRPETMTRKVAVGYLGTFFDQ